MGERESVTSGGSGQRQSERERERERERAVVVAERRESKRHVFFCTILSTLSKRETTHNRRESVPRFFVFFCVSFCVGLHV